MDSPSLTWQNGFESASLSDLGLRRGNNQDSLAVALAGSQENWRRRGHVFIVADGMGAHAAGELASKLATDIVPQTYQKLRDRTPPDALLAAIQDANLRIYSRGQGNEEFKGMGTTLTALTMLPEGALLAQVGDSRAYRLRGERLEQLTFDHSLVWEMRAAGQIPATDDVPSYIPRNIITRSLGPNAEVDVDLEGPFALQVGDTFLLCSDGLSGQVRDDEIGKILACLPPKEAVRALVDLANLRGGPDNITVIAVRVNGVPPAEETIAPSRPVVPDEHKPVPLVLWGLFVTLALAAGGAAALGWNVPAVASGVAAAVVGGMALAQQLSGSKVATFDGGPLGKGPYTSCDAAPDASFVERLAKLNQQLRDAAACEDWVIDWEHYNAQSGQALAASNTGNFAEAVRQYCHAICYMMEQLRSQRDRLRDASDTDFDLA